MNICSVSINRPVLASVISILIVLLGGISSFACDCGPKQTIRSAVGGSHIVIHGKVIKADLNKALQQDSVLLDSMSRGAQRLFFGPQHVNEYTILVIEGFKGAQVNDTIIVRTGVGPVTDCGLVLSSGTDYIIYGKSVFVDHRFLGIEDRTADAFSTSVCSRTRTFSRRERKAIRKAVLSTENVHYRKSY